MITIFAIPKPFKNHIATIQRNALISWTLLRPRPEIILFGEEEGTAEVAAELGLRHVPAVGRNKNGTPLLNGLFDAARNIATNNLLCYVNADIILLSDFMTAAKRVSAWRDRFLMVGRRWDVDIVHAVNFDQPNWEGDLCAVTRRRGKRRGPEWVDYFLFPRSLYQNLPPLALGRLWWDNWLVWSAHCSQSAVVDASSVVLAIHQNHDYSHHPQGTEGVWKGDEAKQNFKLTGGWSQLLRTIADAPYKMTDTRIEPNLWRFFSLARRAVGRCRRFLHSEVLTPFWYRLLGITHPLRHPFGFRQKKVAGAHHGSSDPRVEPGGGSR
jgi:hypothetical protein